LVFSFFLLYIFCCIKCKKKILPDRKTSLQGCSQFKKSGKFILRSRSVVNFFNTTLELKGLLKFTVLKNVFFMLIARVFFMAEKLSTLSTGYMYY